MGLRMNDNERLAKVAPELFRELEESVRLLAAYARSEDDAGRSSQAAAIRRHITRKCDLMRKAIPYWHG
jgi:hypothetical protein